MLSGIAEGLSERGSAKDLLPDNVSELNLGEETDYPLEVLYMASFKKLGSKYVQYDTIIWLSISLVLVLAWGIGVIMLIYLPFRRYVLQKDLASRKLYVTSKEIVYKVSRPSYIPFFGAVNIEKHVPLSMLIDVILEQGWLQSIYGLHTFRIESIVHGKAAPVDDLQVQGIHNPNLLRKVIVTQASKAIQDSGRSWDPHLSIAGGESMSGMESLTLGPAVLRSPSKGFTAVSPYHGSVEARGVVPAELMLNKLEEVKKSVKKIEFLIEKNRGPPSPESRPENI